MLPIQFAEVLLSGRPILVPSFMTSQNIITLPLLRHPASQNQELSQEKIVAGAPTCNKLDFEYALPVRAIFGASASDARQLAEVAKKHKDWQLANIFPQPNDALEVLS